MGKVARVNSFEKKRKAVIFGVSAFAEIAAVYLREFSDYEVVAFTVDRDYIERESILGIPVVPFENIEQSHPPDGFEMFVAVGFKNVNRLRTDLVARCKGRGYRMLSYIDPRALLTAENTFGEHVFIFEANVIQPFVTIGSNTILWSGNHIGHHSRIGSNVFIASHVVISGHVSIGDNTFVGVNATLRDGVKVGTFNVIGAGSSIMKDTPDRAVFRGPKTDPADMTSDQLKF